MAGEVFGVAFGVTANEFGFHADAGSEPLTDTDSEVRGDGSAEFSASGVVATGGENKPVFAEFIGHDTVWRIGFPDYLCRCREVDVGSVGIDYAVVLILFVEILV